MPFCNFLSNERDITIGSFIRGKIRRVLNKTRTVPSYLRRVLCKTRLIFPRINSRNITSKSLDVKKMDLPKFADCNYVAKMQKLRGKPGEKMVNVTFACHFTQGVNRWVNVAFTMFASD